jgi:hypothetical protein
MDSKLRVKLMAIPHVGCLVNVGALYVALIKETSRLCPETALTLRWK